SERNGKRAAYDSQQSAAARQIRQSIAENIAASGQSEAVRLRIRRKHHRLDVLQLLQTGYICALRSEGAYQTSQRRKCCSEVLIDQRREIGMPVARLQVQELRRMRDRGAGSLYLERLSYQGA